jgi:hypothetical protein
MNDNLVPLQEDLLIDTPKMDIFRGLESLIRVDEKIAAGASFEEGDWAVLNDSNELVAPTTTPVANTFPVWAGNAEGRSDVHATGKATVLKGGRFFYRTTKFDPAPNYHNGSPLTVKSLGGDERVPTLATGTEPVLARVAAVAVNGVMDIQVL